MVKKSKFRSNIEIVVKNKNSGKKSKILGTNLGKNTFISNSSKADLKRVKFRIAPSFDFESCIEFIILSDIYPYLCKISPNKHPDRNWLPRLSRFTLTRVSGSLQSFLFGKFRFLIKLRVLIKITSFYQNFEFYF